MFGNTGGTGRRLPTLGREKQQMLHFSPSLSLILFISGLIVCVACLLLENGTTMYAIHGFAMHINPYGGDLYQKFMWAIAAVFALLIFWWVKYNFFRGGGFFETKQRHMTSRDLHGHGAMEIVADSVNQWIANLVTNIGIAGALVMLVTDEYGFMQMAWPGITDRGTTFHVDLFVEALFGWGALSILLFCGATLGLIVVFHYKDHHEITGHLKRNLIQQVYQTGSQNNGQAALPAPQKNKGNGSGVGIGLPSPRGAGSGAPSGISRGKFPAGKLPPLPPSGNTIEGEAITLADEDEEWGGMEELRRRDVEALRKRAR